ncbi:MAG: GTPase HflX [Candidatus Wallbacteria bacterium]|nr:GTPase HflX [Candidatus Wallbacteria bacterium]
MSKNAIIFRLRRSNEKIEETKASLLELTELLKTLHISVVETVIQHKERPSPAFLIGEGKVEEIAQIAAEHSVKLVVSDNNLTPTQKRNLGNKLELEVSDRTAVILEIFRKRARSHEGKLQVEIASMKYSLTMISGHGISMMQQTSGTGAVRSKGIGETQSELDKRKIRKRILVLSKQLEELIKQRGTQRKSRKKQGIPIVSLVGYTNAGKSTLFSLLSKSEAFIADSLFATLDPNVKKVTLPDGCSFLLVDTVGFIKNLPTFLVNAFRATLEEILEGQLLLNVIDFSDPRHDVQEDATLGILSQLGAMNIPRINVYNKLDLLDRSDQEKRLSQNSLNSGHVYISCQEKTGISSLISLIRSKIFQKAGCGE